MTQCRPESPFPLAHVNPIPQSRLNILASLAAHMDAHEYPTTPCQSCSDKRSLERASLRAALWMDVAQTYLRRSAFLPADLCYQGFDMLVALDLAGFEGRRLDEFELAARAGLNARATRDYLQMLEAGGYIVQETDSENAVRALYSLSAAGLKIAQRAFAQFFSTLEGGSRPRD